MRYLGDTHGKQELIPQDGIPTVQVGDLGVGFSPLNLPSNFWFIRGNHDNPHIAKELEEYLGDFGYFGEVFFVSGAMSCDKSSRFEGVNWWREEELPWSKWNSVVESYNGANVIVSHDCPTSIAESIFGIYDKSNTRDGLQVLLESNPPKLWIFGHHHKIVMVEVGQTTFICLTEGEMFDDSKLTK